MFKLAKNFTVSISFLSLVTNARSELEVQILKPTVTPVQQKKQPPFRLIEAILC